MTHQTECRFDRDPETNIPICKKHQKPLEQVALHEISVIPCPPDTTQWRCPISGNSFLQNSNFP